MSQKCFFSTKIHLKTHRKLVCCSPKIYLADTVELKTKPTKQQTLNNFEMNSLINTFASKTGAFVRPMASQRRTFVGGERGFKDYEFMMTWMATLGGGALFYAYGTVMVGNPSTPGPRTKNHTETH